IHYVQLLEWTTYFPSAPSFPKKMVNLRARHESRAAGLLQIHRLFSGNCKRAGQFGPTTAKYYFTDRYLILHIYANRLPGGYVPGKSERIPVYSLSSIRNVFSSSYSGADPSSQRNDAAVR